MRPLGRLLRFVTEHNLVVVVLMLLLTAGVAAGTAHLQLESQAGGGDAVGDTEAAQKLTYVQQSYGNESEQSADVQAAAVYVRDPDGNVLSKAALLESLRFQRAVRENETVAAALGDRGVSGVSNLVATRAAGSADATLAEQIAALERRDPSEVSRLVEETLTAGSPALALLPKSYEPGTATATGRRMVFHLATGGAAGDGASGGVAGGSAATRALYEAAGERSDPAYFTLGEHARRDRNRQFTQNTFELVVPVALLAIVAVLAFSYRDLVDVVVGFTGVALSVLWMFGILGWLRIPAGITLVIGPVLIVGLSVDYGLHVFMRYREQRGGEEGIREPMFRGLSGVTTALGLVTLTTMLGFLSNAANAFTAIRQLSVGITLGVLSTFVVSVTLVPALKVTIDGALERVGLDRRKPPLGHTRVVGRVLRGGVTLARRAAPVVVVLALLAGSAGAVAWTAVDRQAFQQSDGDVAEWKQDLPEPLAWDVAEQTRHRNYVDAQFRAADADSRRQSTVLIEGDAASPGALESVAAVHDRAGEYAAVFERGGSVPLRSPLTVMRSVASEDESFADVYRSADTDGDGVPDRNVEAVFDELFASAPERARLVVDRADGEYRSVRVVVPVSGTAAYPEQADAMRNLADSVDHEDLTVIAVGAGTVNAAESAQTADSILRTLLAALAAVGALLVVVYRTVTGSATLGAVTFVPITLVTALVVGGMYVLDVPLTLLTALLLSLVVGLGIDYNIHVSDRFAHELEGGRSVTDALDVAVRGTGGALLGSTLTSVGAFSALLLSPSPSMQSFGTLVVLALALSFVVAVFVLPSLLTVWARRVDVGPAVTSRPAGAATPQDD